jgi:hypothetical protein
MFEMMSETSRYFKLFSYYTSTAFIESVYFLHEYLRNSSTCLQWQRKEVKAGGGISENQSKCEKNVLKWIED